MPDGSQFPSPAQLSAIRPRAAYKTLFTTACSSDAFDAGFEFPVEPGTDGGFSVDFDGRHIPSVVINGSDGEVTVTGYHAIKQLTDALMAAEKLALRMRGQ